MAQITINAGDNVGDSRADFNTMFTEIYGGFTPAADSGSGSAITPSDTLTIAGGTNVTTSVSGQTVTINATTGTDGTQVKSSITGLTGGGATNLDGLASADYPDNSVVLLIDAGSGIEHWVAKTGAHTEDGTDIVTFDDAAGRYWENYG